MRKSGYVRKSSTNDTSRIKKLKKSVEEKEILLDN